MALVFLVAGGRQDSTRRPSAKKFGEAAIEAAHLAAALGAIATTAAPLLPHFEQRIRAASAASLVAHPTMRARD
jgi:hypothetical protein